MSSFEEMLKKSRIFDNPDKPIATPPSLTPINPPKVKLSLTKISQQCIDLVKQCEGCKLISYQDSVGVWTIGYGHTYGVTPGQVISQQEAEDFLAEELVSFCNSVLSLVRIDLKQNQLDALVSFIYNVGVGNFRNSTMLALINGNNIEAASKQFPRWNKAGGKVLAGLTKRRMLEKALFDL